MGVYSTPKSRNMAKNQDFNEMARKNSETSVLRAAHQKRLAGLASNNRQNEALYARHAQIQRQAYMDFLAQQQHSPFQDWNRARNANVYGG